MSTERESLTGESGPSPDERETLGYLRLMVGQVDHALRSLETTMSEKRDRVALGGDHLDSLKSKIAEIEEDRQALMERLVEAERHASRLMTLYVATYDLHASLDPEEVQAAIADICINMLGADRFALLLVADSDDAKCDVAQMVGSDPEGLFEDGAYKGGDTLIDAALGDGGMRFGPEEGSNALAIVPLSVQGTVVGALVILGLLEHKPDLGPHDREMLDLIGAHAASAMFAARVYTATDSKLKTLQGLVNLIRQK